VPKEILVKRETGEEFLLIQCCPRNGK